MFTSSRSSYSLPRTSSYVPPSRYSTVKSTLPPSTGGYSASRYSTFLTSSSTLPRTTSYSSNSTYSSLYKPVTEIRNWRSSVTSPSLSRKDFSVRPSYTSDVKYSRSDSITSSFTSDTYKSSSCSANVSSSSKELWTPRSYRKNYSLEEVPAKQSPVFESSHHGSPTSHTDSTNLAGRVGLHNLGNTCFMNAVLQCLCHTKPLVEYCKRGSFFSDLNHKSPTGGELIRAFASLIDLLYKDKVNNAVSPDHLKRELQRYAPRFSGYNQQDAQELLRYLLQGLHNDINRVTAKPRRSYSGECSTESQNATDSWRRYQSSDDSKIVDLFGGQLKSTLTCTECNNVSVTFDPFWDLSLPIPEGGSRISLAQCFRLFTNAETLDGHEKPLCEVCRRKTKSTKQLKINKFPVILVIHLKRFSSGLNYRNKLNVTVECSQRNLDLSQFATSSVSNSSTSYNLYGIVDHYGTSSSGHYTAKCKNPYSEEWNEFNDTTVSRISASDLVTDKAYLLFYEQTRQSWSSRL